MLNKTLKKLLILAVLIGVVLGCFYLYYSWDASNQRIIEPDRKNFKMYFPNAADGVGGGGRAKRETTVTKPAQSGELKKSKEEDSDDLNNEKLHKDKSNESNK